MLRTVPVGGEEKTLTLFSHSGKHQRGQIKVHLNILGLEESAPPDVSHRNHKMLFKMLVDRESRSVSFILMTVMSVCIVAYMGFIFA